LSQSGYIAALLLAAFVIFLAAQNRLVTYANVLWGATSKPIPKPTVGLPAAPGAGAAPGGGMTSSLPGVSDAAPALLEAAPELLMLL
jgi:hypothetical protein